MSRTQQKVVVMRKIAGFLAYLFAVNAILAATPTVAVVDFEGINCTQDYARGVTEILSSRLSDTGAFRMIERGQIIRVLEEQAFQTSGLVDPSTAVQIGRILGADYVGVGSITRFGNTYTVSTRFVNVETAEIELADTFTAEGEGKIPEICNNLARMLAGKVSTIHLNIIAKDTNVEVYVDGQYIGICPVVYDVSTGSHKIRFKLSEYYDEIVDVKYAQVDVGKTEVINCPTSRASLIAAREAETRAQEARRIRLEEQESSDNWARVAGIFLLMGLTAGVLALCGVF